MGSGFQLFCKQGILRLSRYFHTVHQALSLNSCRNLICESTVFKQNAKSITKLSFVHEFIYIYL